MTRVKFNIRDNSGKILVKGYTYQTESTLAEIQQRFDLKQFDWTQYHPQAASYDIFSIEAAEI